MNASPILETAAERSSTLGASVLLTRPHQQTPSTPSVRLERGTPATGSSVPVAEMEALIENYLYDCELRLQSPRTFETRRVFLKNFLWFLNYRHYQTCGVAEIRQFLRYLMHGHEEQGGRSGNPNLKRAVRPVTVLDYYVCLRSLFDWMMSQRLIQETPFAFIAKPQMHEESKAPLSLEQLAALFKAVERSAHPLRNRAILALLLDTGCRASEFVTMRVRDLDLAQWSLPRAGQGRQIPDALLRAANGGHFGGVLPAS